jgi:hypothetical protein
MERVAAKSKLTQIICHPSARSHSRRLRMILVAPNLTRSSISIAANRTENRVDLPRGSRFHFGGIDVIENIVEDESVNVEAFDYILGKITDGNLFERFAQSVLSHVIGVEFTPLGGVGDKGMDGLDHTWQSSSDSKTIYQISIEADPRGKIRRTIKALKKNEITFGRLFYVTNQQIRQQDTLMEDIYKEEGVVLQCRDLGWLRGNITTSPATLKLYADFVRNHAHPLTKHAPTLLVADFVTDPRLFVFLQHQLEEKPSDEGLRDMMVDGLILYGLEGTDPDQKILRSQSEIIEQITKVVKFPINQIEGLITERLRYLSTRPRRINHHRTEDKYCLPYQVRLHLDEQNLRDAALFDEFTRLTRERLAKHLSLQKVQVQNPEYLLAQTFNQIFKRQGLDFANFVLDQKDAGVLEKELQEIIGRVLDDAAVPPVTRPQVILALHGAIREIVYRGTESELEYLRKLSRSYMLLFLVQCDPHVCNYFDTLAAKLSVFVCNSILVPTLSEICLQPTNRRHWNLLRQARDAGVRLYINKVTLDELVGNISLSIEAYDTEYKNLETIYSDERTLPYVRPLLVRAYLYQKLQGDPMSFDEFINKFASPRQPVPVIRQEMIVFLREEFGIEYVSDGALAVTVPGGKLMALSTELQKRKRTARQAESDSKTILTIYALREKHNESGTAGIFGYKTWWLSKDTTTHKAVKACFTDKALVSCYLRPDFLLNYIALSKRTGGATKVFDQMFPTLIGVGLSHHVTEEINVAVRAAISKHKALGSSRIKAVIGGMSTKLMTEASASRGGKPLRHYLDEAFRRVGKKQRRKKT